VTNVVEGWAVWLFENNSVFSPTIGQVRFWS